MLPLDVAKAYHLHSSHRISTTLLYHTNIVHVLIPYIHERPLLLTSLLNE